MVVVMVVVEVVEGWGMWLGIVVEFGAFVRNFIDICGSMDLFFFVGLCVFVCV